MSVAAVMLVKDEADVVEYVVRYMLGQVDHLIVSDNGSTDGTREKLAALERELGQPPIDDGYASTPAPQIAGLEVRDDADPAYYQAQKTSALAAHAYAVGHQWVVPCDADEIWYATDGRTLREFLGGLAPDVAYANAALYNHLPTTLDAPAWEICPSCRGEALDDDPPCGTCDGGRLRGEPNPFVRIGWRQREHGALPKVAARLRPGLEIRQGNHSAYAPGSGLAVPGLVVRHFSWRSADQYFRKIANGYRAYAATNLSEDIGAHWRMFGTPDEPTFEERVRAHFAQWFFIDDPYADASLIFDPAPWRLG